MKSEEESDFRLPKIELPPVFVRAAAAPGVEAAVAAVAAVAPAVAVAAELLDVAISIFPTRY